MPSGEHGQEHDLPAGEWHWFGVEFGGPRFSVSFDSVKLYEVGCNLTEPGHVGLCTKADGVTQFDDLEVADDPVIEESKRARYSARSPGSMRKSAP
jgi:hypothetical protein